mgnify:CR=1 FL=1
MLIAAAGKLALGGHDFSIILQVGRAGLVPAPLVGESMQLMPIIGGQRWVAGGGRAESSNMWEEEAGRLDRIMFEPGADSMYSAPPPKPFSPPVDCCSRLDLGSSNSSLFASPPSFCTWNSPWRSVDLISVPPGLYSRSWRSGRVGGRRQGACSSGAYSTQSLRRKNLPR